MRWLVRDKSFLSEFFVGSIPRQDGRELDDYLKQLSERTDYDVAAKEPDSGKNQLTRRAIDGWAKEFTKTYGMAPDAESDQFRKTFSTFITRITEEFIKFKKENDPSSEVNYLVWAKLFTCFMRFCANSLVKPGSKMDYSYAAPAFSKILDEEYLPRDNEGNDIASEFLVDFGKKICPKKENPRGGFFSNLLSRDQSTADQVEEAERERVAAATAAKAAQEVEIARKTTAQERVTFLLNSLRSESQYTIIIKSLEQKFIEPLKILAATDFFSSEIFVEYLERLQEEQDRVLFRLIYVKELLRARVVLHPPEDEDLEKALKSLVQALEELITAIIIPANQKDLENLVWDSKAAISALNEFLGSEIIPVEDSALSAYLKTRTINFENILTEDAVATWNLQFIRAVSEKAEEEKRIEQEEKERDIEEKEKKERLESKEWKQSAAFKSILEAVAGTFKEFQQKLPRKARMKLLRQFMLAYGESFLKADGAVAEIFRNHVNTALREAGTDSRESIECWPRMSPETTKVPTLESLKLLRDFYGNQEMPKAISQNAEFFKALKTHLAWNKGIFLAAFRDKTAEQRAKKSGEKLENPDAHSIKEFKQVWGWALEGFKALKSQYDSRGIFFSRSDWTKNFRVFLEDYAQDYVDNDKIRDIFLQILHRHLPENDSLSNSAIDFWKEFAQKKSKESLSKFYKDRASAIPKDPSECVDYFLESLAPSLGWNAELLRTALRDHETKQTDLLPNFTIEFDATLKVAARAFKSFKLEYKRMTLSRNEWLQIFYSFMHSYAEVVVDNDTAKKFFLTKLFAHSSYDTPLIKEIWEIIRKKKKVGPLASLDNGSGRGQPPSEPGDADSNSSTPDKPSKSPDVAQSPPSNQNSSPPPHDAGGSKPVEEEVASPVDGAVMGTSNPSSPSLGNRSYVTGFPSTFTDDFELESLSLSEPLVSIIDEQEKVVSSSPPSTPAPARALTLRQRELADRFIPYLETTHNHSVIEKLFIAQGVLDKFYEKQRPYQTDRVSGESLARDFIQEFDDLKSMGGNALLTKWSEFSDEPPLSQALRSNFTKFLNKNLVSFSEYLLRHAKGITSENIKERLPILFGEYLLSVEPSFKSCFDRLKDEWKKDEEIQKKIKAAFDVCVSGILQDVDSLLRAFDKLEQMQTKISPSLDKRGLLQSSAQFLPESLRKGFEALSGEKVKPKFGDFMSKAFSKEFALLLTQNWKPFVQFLVQYRSENNTFRMTPENLARFFVDYLQPLVSCSSLSGEDSQAVKDLFSRVFSEDFYALLRDCLSSFSSVRNLCDTKVEFTVDHKGFVVFEISKKIEPCEGFVEYLPPKIEEVGFATEETVSIAPLEIEGPAPAMQPVEDIEPHSRKASAEPMGQIIATKMLSKIQKLSLNRESVRDFMDAAVEEYEANISQFTPFEAEFEKSFNDELKNEEVYSDALLYRLTYMKINCEDPNHFWLLTSLMKEIASAEDIARMRTCVMLNLGSQKREENAAVWHCANLRIASEIVLRNMNPNEPAYTMFESTQKLASDLESKVNTYYKDHHIWLPEEPVPAEHKTFRAEIESTINDWSQKEANIQFVRMGGPIIEILLAIRDFFKDLFTIKDYYTPKNSSNRYSHFKKQCEYVVDRTKEEIVRPTISV